ncbi:MAG: hypothetical protein ACI4OY_04905 [Aristaeellaceae bacterium]
MEVGTKAELRSAISAAGESTVIVLSKDITFSDDEEDEQNGLSLRSSKTRVQLDLNGHTLSSAVFTRGNFEVMNGRLDVPSMQPSGGTVTLVLGDSLTTREVTLSHNSKGSIEVVNYGVITGARGLCCDYLRGCPATVSFVNEGIVDCGIGVFFNDENVSSGALTVVNHGLITGALTGAWIRSVRGTRVSFSGTGVLQGGCGVWIFGSERSAGITIDQQIRSGVGSSGVYWEHDGKMLSPATMLMQEMAMVELMVTYIGADLFDVVDSAGVKKRAQERAEMLAGLAWDEENEAFYPELLTSFQNLTILRSDEFLLTESFGMAVACWNEDASVPCRTNVTLKGSLWGEKALLMVPGESFAGKLNVSAASAQESPSRRVLLTCDEPDADDMRQWTQKAVSDILDGALPAGTEEIVVYRQGGLYQREDESLCYLPTAYAYSAGDMLLLWEDTALNPDDGLRVSIRPVEKDERGIRQALAAGRRLYQNIDMSLFYEKSVKDIIFDHVALKVAERKENHYSMVGSISTDQRLKTQAQVLFTDSVTMEKDACLYLGVNNQGGLHVINEAELADVEVMVGEGPLKLEGNGRMDLLQLNLTGTPGSVEIRQDMDSFLCFLGTGNNAVPTNSTVTLEGQAAEITLNALNLKNQKNLQTLSFQMNCTDVRDVNISFYDPDVKPGAILTEAQAAALLRKHLPRLDADLMPEGETYELSVVVHTQLGNEDSVSYEGRASGGFYLPAGNAVELLEQMAKERESLEREQAEREALEQEQEAMRSVEYDAFLKELETYHVSLPETVQEISGLPNLSSLWEQLQGPAISMFDELLENGSAEMIGLPEGCEFMNGEVKYKEGGKSRYLKLTLSEGILTAEGADQLKGMTGNCSMLMTLMGTEDDDYAEGLYLGVYFYTSGKRGVIPKWIREQAIPIYASFDGIEYSIVVHAESGEWTGFFAPDGRLTHSGFSPQ